MIPRKGRGAVSATGALPLVVVMAATPGGGVAAQDGWLEPAKELVFVAEVAFPAIADDRFQAMETSGAVIVPVSERMTVVGGISLTGARADGLATSAVISYVYGSLQLGAAGPS